ncbi:Nucleolar protein 56 [Pleurostoma richardsiae]|uniref:Nucleolar protein 56 n=1 Tax=Pleurostoma richardsiae TaxID=41990 RepID=A0AA38VTZ4_9PEZI|nr:Nucleolar protein 56 [Pleurostoma richardsiae]
MAAVNYLLYESAAGYAIFEVVHQASSVGLRLQEVQNSMRELSTFGKMVKLVNFTPYRSAAETLENINLVSEGVMSDYLKNILELNLPKTSGKKSKIVLGVQDKKLAGEISGAFAGVECETGDTSEVVADLLRGIRQHAEKLLKGLQEGDLGRAQLGMGHAYSRAKVKFSVHKNDNHIIQAIATLDALDKGINSGCMRVREWYGWHFPELIRIVSDNVTYAKLVLTIGNKKTLTDDRLHEIAAVIDDDGEKAEDIIHAAKVSMGQDISEADLTMVKSFAKSVSDMAAYRRQLSTSLDKKMKEVAPNLQVILGTPVAARLISHAGSLTNLAKYPASTLQILGAEKALFRALKTKGATPKYGLIYSSSFIGRAGAKTKGRISRYLANKCSIASRIDNFSEHPSSRFGEVLRQQLEDRLEFYSTGKKPTKNEDAMKAAMQAILEEGGDMAIDTEMIDVHDGHEAAEEEKPSKKDKKEKKDKKRKSDVGHDDAEVKKEKKKRKSDVGEEDGEKKKKKKRKSEVVEA